MLKKEREKWRIRKFDKVLYCGYFKGKSRRANQMHGAPRRHSSRCQWWLVILLSPAGRFRVLRCWWWVLVIVWPTACVSCWPYSPRTPLPLRSSWPRWPPPSQVSAFLRCAWCTLRNLAAERSVPPVGLKVAAGVSCADLEHCFLCVWTKSSC